MSSLEGVLTPPIGVYKYTCRSDIMVRGVVAEIGNDVGPKREQKHKQTTFKPKERRGLSPKPNQVTCFHTNPTGKPFNQLFDHSGLLMHFTDLMILFYIISVILKFLNLAQESALVLTRHI